MKHFIYLNTDVLNSYLSQINDGLINSTQTEVKDEVSTERVTETTEGNAKTETSIGFSPILGMKFSEDPDVLTTTSTLSQLESGKELIEKLLHDNAFQKFSNYLKENDKIKELSCSNLGDYVYFSGEYSLRDLDHILSIFTDEFIDFISEQGLENCTKAVKNQKKAEKKALNNNSRRIISLAKSSIPEPKFILCNDCFIPLKDKFLREDIPSIRFNYTGKLHILGKYTSTIAKSVNIESREDTFTNVFKSFDELNRSLYNDIMNIPLDSKVIMPIALYFE